MIYHSALILCVVSSQEIGGTSGGEENGKKKFMIPEHQSESEDSWSEGDTGHSGDIPGRFRVEIRVILA